MHRHPFVNYPFGAYIVHDADERNMLRFYYRMLRARFDRPQARRRMAEVVGRLHLYGVTTERVWTS